MPDRRRREPTFTTGPGADPARASSRPASGIQRTLHFPRSPAARRARPAAHGGRPMTTPGAPATRLPAWRALEAHYQQVRGVQLRRLFADDPGRGERLTREAAGLYVDYSKNRVTDETLKLLLRLADE